MEHPLLDIPIGGTVIPKEEIKKAPILKIEVYKLIEEYNLIGCRRLCCAKEY